MTQSVTPTGSRTPQFQTLGERLWWARETAPLTQLQLAALLGISDRTVQNYEANKFQPPLNRLLLWANACNADFDWLAGDAYAAGDGDGIHPRKRAQTGGRASTATVRSIRRQRDDSAGDTAEYKSQRDYVCSQNVTIDQTRAQAA